MRNILEILIAGPTAAALSGERKKAFYRQWAIRATIVFVLIIIGFILFINPEGITTDNFNNYRIIGLIALVVAGLFALLRKEAVWQLRLRELRHLKHQKQSNRAELDRFAEELKMRNHAGK